MLIQVISVFLGLVGCAAVQDQGAYQYAPRNHNGKQAFEVKFRDFTPVLEGEVAQPKIEQTKSSGRECCRP